MKRQFVCWEKGNEDDPGESPPTRSVVDDYWASSAAEEFAERAYNDSGEHVDHMTIMVRDPVGSVSEFKVSVEFTPTFIAEQTE